MVYLHCGHNDVSFHKRKNPSPSENTESVLECLSLAIAVCMFLPNTRVVMSILFPRVCTVDYSFEKAVSYNRLALRMSRSLHVFLKHPQLSLDYKSRMSVSFVKDLWVSIRNAIGDRMYFNPDGLHLCLDGKAKVAVQWMKDLPEIN